VFTARHGGQARLLFRECAMGLVCGDGVYALGFRRPVPP